MRPADIITNAVRHEVKSYLQEQGFQAKETGSDVRSARPFRWWRFNVMGSVGLRAWCTSTTTSMHPRWTSFSGVPHLLRLRDLTV
jgi:hypothetical protein